MAHKCTFGWVQVSAGRSRRVCIDTSEEHRAASHPDLTPTHAIIGGDPTRWDAERAKKVYGLQELTAHVDLQDPVAAKEWPGYITSGPNQGPRPFSTLRERRSYMARYGFSEG